MEYNDKPLMTDDYLKLIKFLCTDLFEFKIVKILLSIVLLVHVSATLITAYFMVYVMDSKEVLNYSSVFTGIFYPMLAIAVLLLKGKIVSNIGNEVPLWTIDSAGPKIHFKIKQEIRFITIFVVVTSIVALSGAISYTINLHRDDDFIFVLRFSRDYFPCVQFFYKTTFVVIGYVMVVHAFQATYYSQHIRYQMLLFKKYLSEIANCTESFDEKELFYKEEYQLQVRKRLIFCIERYKQFITVLDKKLKDMSNLVAVFAVGGCLLGISIVLFFVAGNMTPEYYPRLALTSVATVAAFSCGILAGQSIETESEAMVTTINEVNWYNFNRSNKTLYLFFSMNVMKERQIKFSDDYSLNYELGLAIVRGIYSVVSVLASMKKNY